MLMLAAGLSPAGAQVTETFEDLTLVDADSWGRAGEFSNGWICVNSSGVKNSTGLHESSNDYPYFIGTIAKNGSKSLGSISSNNQSYYLVIPVLMSGDVTFSMCTNSTNTSTYGYVRIHKVTDNGDGTYSINSVALSTQTKAGSSSYTWAEKTVALGEEETMIAIRANRAFIDDFTYTPYVEAGCKKPKNLSISNITSSSADFSWTKGDDGDTAWQIVYSTDANFDKDAATPIDVNTTSYSFSELNANTTYYVAVRTYAGRGEGEQSAWVTTSFKTEKVAVPATGFTDNFETDKGWDLINGTCPNKWVIGTGTNNGGSKSLYISQDGTSYASSYGSSSLVYASMLLRFEAGDYTVAYDWMCNGEGTYDFMRVGLVPASVGLSASTSYSSLGSGSTLPTGWTMWLDGGSKLGGSTSWATKSVDFTIDTAGNYQVVFAWRNDYSGGSTPAAIDNFKILGSAPVLEVGGDVVGTTLAFGSVSETTVKTITITNSGKVAMENITLAETADADNAFAAAALSKTTLASGESMNVEVTFSGTTAKDYTATYRVDADDVDAIDIEVTATYSNAPAQIAVKFGEDAVGETVAFGSVSKAISKTFTVTNDGDQTLNVTIASDNTTDFTVSPAALAVTGHTSETFTVTFVYPNESPVLNAEKTANITVTPSNEGLSPVTFAVTGTRIEMWSEDFSGNALPSGWTAEDYWTFSSGVAHGAYNYSYNRKKALTTPMLVVTGTSDILSYKAKSTSTSVRIIINYSKDGGGFTKLEEKSLANNMADFETYSITGLEAGNYKFQFMNDDYDLDDFEGFKLNADDPKFGIYTDAGCTTAAAASVTKDFGFVTTTAEAQVYYLKNDNTGTLTLTLGDVPTGFTAALGKASLAAGESTTLTIGMSVETKGYKNGDIVVTAKNSSDTEIGTFTVAASGVTVDENKLNLDFATADIPASWTNTNFTKNAKGYIESNYASGTLQTSTLTAEAGETIIIVAKQGYSSSSYTTTVNYRKVGDEEWSTLIAAQNLYNNANWQMITGTIAEAGDYELQFVGQYVQIQHIYGLTEPQIPYMAVYDGTTAAAASYSFGNVANDADATHTFTIKNEGNGTLAGVTATLSGDQASHYAVEIDGLTNGNIAGKSEATLIVKQLKDNIGAHAATLTISSTSDGIDDIVIALSGTTRDASKMYVDFADGIPATWTTTGNWTTSSGYAQAPWSGNATLTSPALTIAAGENLTVDLSKQYNNNNAKLTFRYTTDGGINWTEQDLSSDLTYGEFTTKTLSLGNTETVTAFIQFVGTYYARIDNIYGGVATTAPLFALATEETLSDGKYDFGQSLQEAPADKTFTITNNGNDNLVSTIAVTGDVTATLATTAGELSNDNKTVTLEPGETATLTVSLTFNASQTGTKSGNVTISSNAPVANVSLDFTANVIDATSLNIDFADNSKPTGFYSNGWTYTSGYAANSNTTEAEFITSLLTVAGAEDALTYQARAAWDNYSEALTVSYSTDRKNWTEVATLGESDLTTTFQTFRVSGLEAGNYYLRFTGARVYVDNISGWHFATPIAEHDLYISATTFPTTTLIPATENGVEASATVYSLRANETGVTAKLFFGETEIATAAAKDIAKDGSATFTMTGNVPAEEGTYAAKIRVYYSDNSVAWETAKKAWMLTPTTSSLLPST